MQASLERLRRRREEVGEGEEEGGFTLIELLIVIVILGILAAIVVFAVQNLTTSSSQASCGSDVKTVETAVEAYKAQIGVYPGDTPTGWTVTAGPTANGYPGDTTTMGDLLGTAVTTNGGVSPIGPWLKDTPYNPGHYAVSVVQSTTAGQAPSITVINGSNTATLSATTPNPCSVAS